MSLKMEEFIVEELLGGFVQKYHEMKLSTRSRRKTPTSQLTPTVTVRINKKTSEST